MELDAHPMLGLYDMVQGMGGAKIYSTRDLKSGYWQFRVMPFGLKNAPVTFFRLVSEVFPGLVSKFVLVYLDDILVYSESPDQHLNHLQSLGAIPVLQLPVPKKIKDVLQVLGVCGWYSQFVPHYAKITAPLTRLLAKGIKWHWSEIEQEAFLKLKESLVFAPRFCPPLPGKPFNLQTDASEVGGDRAEEGRRTRIITRCQRVATGRPEHTGCLVSTSVEIKYSPVELDDDGRTSKSPATNPQQPAIPWHDCHVCGKAPGDGHRSWAGYGQAQLRGLCSSRGSPKDACPLERTPHSPKPLDLGQDHSGECHLAEHTSAQHPVDGTQEQQLAVVEQWIQAM
ncbi:hypothetical protein QTP88_016557 [Uroleucon formosanum]